MGDCIFGEKILTDNSSGRGKKLVNGMDIHRGWNGRM
jgi:hypothetical protein